MDTRDLCELDIDNLTLRELQLECARALTRECSTNNTLSKFNKEASHNSHNWYKAVIKDYVDRYGDLPSKAGPGKFVKLLLE